MRGGKKIDFDAIFLKGKINAKGLDVYKRVRKVILWKLANYSQDKKNLQLMIRKSYSYQGLREYLGPQSLRG